MALLPALVYGIAAFFSNAQTTADLIKAEEQQRLSACLQMQEDAPEEAYEDGLAWLMEGNRPAARYCTATSLIALGKFVDGATRLEELAMAADGGTVEDRAIYFAQAGNAWLLAGLPEEAIIAITAAIKFNANDPALFIDRARAQLTLEKWSEGEADLDEAIAMQPGDIDAYILRGEARLRQDRYDEAMDDVLQARALDETNIEALLLRGRIREEKRLAEGG